MDFTLKKVLTQHIKVKEILNILGEMVEGCPHGSGSISFVNWDKLTG